MERLNCTFNNYSWGKHGTGSEVARLYADGHEAFTPSEELPYSELWMGTHPDGPARIRSTGEKLSEYVARKAEDVKKSEIHLPFIMKVMSINQALSLQVHPTKEQAARLNAKDPKNYPDANHKPELAYAISRFELFCGFRPAEEIIENMKAFPELRAVMGEAACQSFQQIYESGYSQDSKQMKTALAICFANMLYMQVTDPEFVSDQLDSLEMRLADGVRGCITEDTVKLINKMFGEFPNDVGCFTALYLNHMILQPGECCYYASEELHAYLEGECVECVGCSNNTIRAALTQKFIDREALIEVLNYRMTKPDYYMVPPKVLDNYPHVIEYAPDCKDFQLHHIEISEQHCNTLPATIPPLDCQSIIVIYQGEGYCNEVNANGDILTPTQRHIKRGDIFYIPPGCIMRIEQTNGERFLAYRTFSYEEGPDHSKRHVAQAVMPNIVKAQFNPKDFSKMFKTLGEPKEVANKAASGTAEVFDVETELDGFC